MTWRVYLLRCSNGTLYAGITTDLVRRLEEHGGRGTRGARYTKGRRPVRLAWSEAHPDRSSAATREWEVKRMSREKKEALIRTPGKGRGKNRRAANGKP